MLTLEPTTMTLAANEHVGRLQREAAHQRIERIVRTQASAAAAPRPRPTHGATRERGTLELGARSFWKRWAV